ncbi:MAG: biotin--[acetyl-CoA-carboxylase] ligase [Bacteroidales bacterium]|nr:biotin--[acetyl-CoA-carboxylase] ligase [Bacteroidales bacterium]
MIIGSELIFYRSLPSTNDEASVLLREKEIKEGTVIYTDFQAAGKGQMGNRWESDACKNLLFSIILYPTSVEPEGQFIISMALSLGICDFIDRHISGSKIKWPNDIYIGNDKIAGILIENSIIGDNIENTIAGIGLNINQEDFRGKATNPVSFKMITGEEYDLKGCLGQLLSDLDKRYRQLLYGDRNLIAGDYKARLYRLMEWCEFRSGENVFTGRILGVSSSGRLRIGDRKSRVTEFSFREVEIIT